MPGHRHPAAFPDRAPRAMPVVAGRVPAKHQPALRTLHVDGLGHFLSARGPHDSVDEPQLLFDPADLEDPLDLWTALAEVETV